MERLDILKITEEFKKLSQLSEDELPRYNSVIASAKAYFERLLRREPLEEEAELCTYACACKAFFVYTVLRASEFKTFSSSTGGLYTRISEDTTVKFAERLYKNALAALPEGLVRDCGFVFESTEG